MIICSGFHSDSDGASYDPETSKWEEIDAGPFGSDFGQAAIWTGEIIIISSEEGFAGYNPKTKEWIELPDPPICARRSHAAIWTGEEMIIWGGGQQSCKDGARWNL
jgi:hypothetical protein